MLLLPDPFSHDQIAFMSSLKFLFDDTLCNVDIRYR